MNKEIKNALNIVEDEEIEMSFLERFDALGQELIANSFKAIKKIQKYGISNPISAEEMYIQEESMKQFKIIDKVLSTLTRSNRIKSSPNENFDAQLMKKIKGERGTIGEIEVKIPKLKIVNSGK